MSQLSSPSTVRSVTVTKISAVLVSLYTRDEIIDKSSEHFRKSTAEEPCIQTDIDPSKLGPSLKLEYPEAELHHSPKCEIPQDEQTVIDLGLQPSIEMPDSPASRPVNKRVARCVSNTVDWDEDLRPSNEPGEVTAYRGSTEATSVPSPLPGDTYTFNDSHKPRGATSASKGKAKRKKPSTGRLSTTAQRTVSKKTNPKKRGAPESDEAGKDKKLGNRRKRLIVTLRHVGSSRSAGTESPRALLGDKASVDAMLSPAVTEKHLETLLSDKENMNSILSIVQIPGFDGSDGIELHRSGLQGESIEGIIAPITRSQSLECLGEGQAHPVEGSSAAIYTIGTMTDKSLHNKSDELENLTSNDNSPPIHPESSMAFLEDRSWKAQGIGTEIIHHGPMSIESDPEGISSSLSTSPSVTSDETPLREHRTQSSSQESLSAEAVSISRCSPQRTPRNTIVDTNGSPRLLSEKYKEHYKTQILVLDDAASPSEFYRGHTTGEGPASFANRLKLCAARDDRPEISGPIQKTAVQKMLLETSESLNRHIESENTTISEVFESFRKSCHDMLDQLSEAQEARIRLCQQQMEGIRKHHSKICEELVHRMERDEQRFQKLLDIT
ncbi:hypothetical protein BO86DRAFT_388748 [Aspergillus japonicus CBS 114.51]|uniref:Uncharacterized protein n=1 Tax=Aspergillus japonicus CBS 114.51 TaxID=1448312 RepID=A0A8T8X4K5_ASPJA|nr:hypothetical protein BO86DRAFT_388748 [Aspergillus japonicus CBS 114.51]RAH82582.1 hypothetical protein BO86DRAFT_388748 [Aspergillus japonicus CBS 114.51]